VSAAKDPRLELDLIRDFAAYAKGECAALGIDVDGAEADVDPFVLYFNVCESFIPARQRVVYLPQGFDCPRDAQAGVDALLGRVRSGESLRPHQTSLQLSSGPEDSLLVWGIRCFHLGTAVQPDGLVERTSRVLCARVTDFSFFVLGVFEEGLWTLEGLVRTIHEDWPDSIERFRLRGVPIRGPSSDGVFEMSDGTWYAPIGSGSDAGSTNARAMTWASAIRARLGWWEEQIQSNIADMRKEFPAIFAAGAREIRLRGEVDGRDLFVVHEATRTRIWVGQLF
jgi:hypothetical protein